MKIINIRHIATLSNLSLKEDETTKFEKQLGDIVGYIQILQSVNLDDTPPTNQVTGLENVTVEDMQQPSLPQSLATAQGKHVQNGHFLVSGILEGE
jgi:aspartyl-tRNA(Asn)/glutamyl-tRNA(Gln) amidotransferase subunit C